MKRIWQPDDSKIQMRWQVRGVPRVPWSAEGVFDGVSVYKLDREGKIFEHYVDNVILRDPPVAFRLPLFSVQLQPVANGPVATQAAQDPEPAASLPAFPLQDLQLIREDLEHLIRHEPPRLVATPSPMHGAFWAAFLAFLSMRPHAAHTHNQAVPSSD